jgi:hypothetical protein
VLVDISTMPSRRRSNTAAKSAEEETSAATSSPAMYMQAEGSDDEDHELRHAGTKANLVRLNNGNNDEDDYDDEGLLTPRRKLDDNEDEDDEANKGEVEDDLECYNVADEYDEDDVSWTVSIGSGEYETDDEDEDGTEWIESPMRFKDYSVKINNVDTQFEYDYHQEVRQLRKNVRFPSILGNLQTRLSVRSCLQHHPVLRERNWYTVTPKPRLITCKRIRGLLDFPANDTVFSLCVPTF